MTPLDLDGLDGLFSSDLPPAREHLPPSAVVVVEETVRFSLEGSAESMVAAAPRGRPWLWFSAGAGLGGLSLGALVVGFAAGTAWLTRSVQSPVVPPPAPAPVVVPAPAPSEVSPPPTARPAAVPTEWVVHFAHDSVEPLDAAVPDWLGQCAAIDVVGYTDATGAPDVNDRIGSGRAEAVRRLLTDAGVPRVTARSAGEHDADPAAPPDRRDRDRRAVARCSR